MRQDNVDQSESSGAQCWTTTNTFLFSNFSETTIDSFEFKQTSDGNFIEVVKRQASPQGIQAILYSTSSTPRVWKEIYGITDEHGKQALQLLETIEGKVTPSHHVDESVIF